MGSSVLYLQSKEWASRSPLSVMNRARAASARIAVRLDCHRTYGVSMPRVGQASCSAAISFACVGESGAERIAGHSAAGAAFSLAALAGSAKGSR